MKTGVTICQRAPGATTIYICLPAFTRQTHSEVWRESELYNPFTTHPERPRILWIETSLASALLP